MANITKRVSKKGVVSYKIRVSLGYDENHKQVTRSITWTPEPDMTERQIQKELSRQVAVFESNAVQIPKNSRRVKFRELSEEWLNFVKTTGDMKISTYERMLGLKDRTYKFLGSFFVDEITYRNVQQFIVSIAKNGNLSEKTQKHYLTFVSDVMRYAMKCEMIDRNPCAGVSVVKTGKRAREVYTIEEDADVLFKMKEQNVPLKYRVFFALAIYCGLRRGEIMGLEWKDVNFENRAISIVRTSNYRNSNTGIYSDTPKTESSTRFIVVTDPVIELLTELKSEQDEQKDICGDQWIETDRLLTQWNGQPMNPNTPYTFLQRFCDKNDIPFKGVHSFRHSFATNLIASNKVDIRTVSGLMGHSQTSTTMNIYAHEVKKASARGIRVMADLLENEKNKAHG